MIKYRVIKYNLSALKEMWDNNWELKSIYDDKMIFSKHIVSKKDRENKQLTKSPEFIEFASLYPKKADLSSDKLIEKYNWLVWQHQVIMEWLKRYINYIEVEKLAPKFIKNATTWINNKCWENEYKVLENRFWYNKKFIADMLQWINSDKVEIILNQVKIREAKTKKEINEWVLENIIESIK